VFEVNSFTWPELTGVLLEAASAQFRAAAIELAEASRRHRKLVAVTAAHRGEGCTAVTTALAKALADEQQRVILVDAHFGAPGMSDSLGLAPQVGWEDVLSGEKPLTEALIESLEDRITVLPLRQSAAEDWRLSIARLKASFDELRRHCDLVLVDAGPLGDTADRRHLLSWAAPCRVDRALVVRDLRATSDLETSEIERRLHGCGIAQWNFVENFAA
jgi:Mrp family chromosome partitioning ATPase